MTLTGYTEQLEHEKRTLPLLKEIRAQAKREGRDVVARVLLPDDTIATIKAGTRGGLRILARMYARHTATP